VQLLFALLLSASFAAHADLYRWIDRETGSVKFSNTPPPWYGDAEKQRGAPAVEVVPYRGPGTGPAPKPTPQTEGAAAEARAIAVMEARWLELVRFFASLPPSTDFSRAGPNIRPQLEAYQTLSADLERLDPAGAPRRRAQQANALANIRRGSQLE
jgi:hypothetical protein